MILAMTIVTLIGIGLIATGAVYWIRKEKMNSDPVLIASCFGYGTVLLASSVISSL